MSDIIQAGVGIASFELLVSQSAHSYFSGMLACRQLSLIDLPAALRWSWMLSARWEMFIDPVGLTALILCRRDTVRELIRHLETYFTYYPGWRLGFPPELMELHKWPAPLHWELW